MLKKSVFSIILLVVTFSLEQKRYDYLGKCDYYQRRQNFKYSTRCWPQMAFYVYQTSSAYQRELLLSILWLLCKMKCCGLDLFFMLWQYIVMNNTVQLLLRFSVNKQRMINYNWRDKIKPLLIFGIMKSGDKTLA